MRSDLENAIQNAGGIVRSGSNLELPGVGTVLVEGMPAQDSCEQIYSESQAYLASYSGAVEKDAEHISAIAQAWEEIDQAVKSNYSAKG